jgi:hypothetical protein
MHIYNLVFELLNKLHCYLHCTHSNSLTMADSDLITGLLDDFLDNLLNSLADSPSDSPADSLTVNLGATSFPADCLPPEATYETHKVLFISINSWAAIRGYAFIIGHSTIEKSGRLTVTYVCDQACQSPTYISTEHQRRTTSRGTSCLFSVLAKEVIDST